MNGFKHIIRKSDTKSKIFSAKKNLNISFDDTALVFQHFMRVRFMGHTTRYTCPIKKMLICKEEKEMGIVVSVMALVLYVPMSMVFVLGGKK